jgi:type 1 glutamine amidotransferase
MIAPLVQAAPKKLLVVEVTMGYRHASIETAERVLTQLANQTGEFTLDYVRQPPGAPTIVFKPRPGPAGESDPAYQQALKKFESDHAAYEAALKAWVPKAVEALQALAPANLAKYDGVIFDSTTGALPLPDKAAFLKWIAEGHAFIGVHSATDTFHDDKDFIEMLGGEFKTHGPQVEVECLNEDPKHPATEMLPAKWVVFDEIYQFKNHDRAAVHELLALDKHPNEKTPGFYPLAWCKQYHRGRVFYTALGHRDEIWDPAASDRKNSPEVAKLFQQHVLGGIRWALRLTGGTAEPNR